MLKSIRGVFQRRCQCPFLCHLQHLLLSHLVENNGRYGWELHTLQLRTTDATVENNGRKLSVTVLRLSTNLLLSSAKFRLISMHYAHFCQGENESRQIQHHWQPCLFSFNTPKAGHFTTDCLGIRINESILDIWWGTWTVRWSQGNERRIVSNALLRFL